MDNYQIADTFSLLSKLMDIHGENSFKSKSYSVAAFTIEKLPVQLIDLSDDKIAGIKGIGNSTAQKIRELLDTGKLKQLETLVNTTPPGVIEMLNIKGIGPKKIHSIWKEMEIESIGELLYACQENRLKLYKGFGEKTQQNVIDTIEFYFKNKESHLYAQVALVEEHISSFLKAMFPASRVSLTGAFLRQVETIDELEYVLETTVDKVRSLMNKEDGFTEKQTGDDWIIYRTSAGISIKLYCAEGNMFDKKSIETSFHSDQWELIQQLPEFSKADFSSDQNFFRSIHSSFIPTPLRENKELFEWIIKNGTPELIQTKDIKGIIHAHSNWSDGAATIEEMASALKQRGLEYLVISDHSKTAFYANGLSIERLKEQQNYIDELNKKLVPFKIFKSIESDILNDGSLDYPDEILASFDLVIASVHSNLKMTEDKAMQRLLTAIANPYTTILGHLTGRLLLSRAGYPVNYGQVFEACLKNNVAIELNAHPNRLDIDWRFIRSALDRGLKISIDPDAHFIEGFDDVKYGVLVAQKAGVTKSDNLSSLSLNEFERYLSERKTRIKR